MISRIVFLTVLGCSAAAATAVVAEDWPQFRGPDGQGRSSLTGLPLEWSESSNIAWKQSLPGNGWSSPVLINGRIVLTTAVETGSNGSDSDTQYSLRTVCLDAATGTELWNTETGSVPAGASMHPKNSHASATPVVTADRIYVHFSTYGTAALNHDGEIFWETDILYKPRHGTGSSPVLFEDLLIINCDGEEDPFVLALDTANGQERWRAARPEVEAKKTFSFSTPLVIDVDGQAQLISPGSDVVCSYDPRNGELLWMVRYPDGFSVVPRPVYADGLVLVCTGFEGPADLLAIRPDGRGDVTDSHVVWSAEKFVPHSPSPLVDDSKVYLISDNGIASCRDLATGDLLWKERVGGAFSASPILADGRIYFLSEDGVCTVIRAAPEFERLARNHLNERSLASIVPTQGSLLIRTISGLYRIDQAP